MSVGWSVGNFWNENLVYLQNECSLVQSCTREYFSFPLPSFFTSFFPLWENRREKKSHEKIELETFSLSAQHLLSFWDNFKHSNLAY